MNYDGFNDPARNASPLAEMPPTLPPQRAVEWLKGYEYGRARAEEAAEMDRQAAPKGDPTMTLLIIVVAAVSALAIAYGVGMFGDAAGLWVFPATGGRTHG